MAGIDRDERKWKPAMVGFPFDENSSYLQGAAAAPPLIRSALFSEASNLWSENGTDLGGDSVIVEAGDLVALPGKDLFAQIEASILRLLDRELRPIALGGDHAITYPVIRAVAKRYPALTILDFDAHPDLYDEFQGSRISHACPFARVMEERLARRLVQVGIRTMNGDQRRQVERFGIEVIEMKDWHGALPGLESPVYVSIDLDALDPAFAPGVAHREPGGLSVREVLNAIQGLRAQVVGADIVEFNPSLDPLGITAVVGAKILKEIAAKMLETASAARQGDA